MAVLNSNPATPETPADVADSVHVELVWTVEYTRTIEALARSKYINTQNEDDTDEHELVAIMGTAAHLATTLEAMRDRMEGLERKLRMAEHATT